MPTTPRERPKNRAAFIVAAVTLVLVAVAGVAIVRTLAPSVTIERFPAILASGDVARIMAATNQAGDCTLRLTSAGAAPISADSVPSTGPSRITWRFAPTLLGGSRRWDASVRCTQDGEPVAASQRASLLVTASPGQGPRPASRPREITASVTAAPPRTRAAARIALSALQILVAVGGLFFVWRQLFAAKEQIAAAKRQIEQGREEATADRTAQITERYLSRPFLEVWARVGPGFLQVDSDGECFERMRLWQQAPHGMSKLDIASGKPDEDPSKRPPTSYSEVFYAANFHEELAVLFMAKTVNREQIIRHFCAVLVNAFATSWWWIHWQRENQRCPEAYDGAKAPATGETEYFTEWERMARLILEVRGDLTPSCDQRVWIACLPPPQDQRDGMAWRRFREVSARLSRPIAGLPDLERELCIDDTAPAAPFVQTARVLCLMSWPAHAERAVELQRIASALHPLSLEELEALVGRLPAGESYASPTAPEAASPARR